MTKKTKKMTDQEDFINTMLIGDSVYDVIVSELAIPKDDEVYRNLVVGMLKRQTRNHLVFSIWNNLNDAQIKHFREFFNQTAIIAPDMDHEEVLMQFALMYPDLMDKVHKSLSDFFKNFIESFNELYLA